MGSEYIWIWRVAIIEPENKEILGTSISKNKICFVAIERFISDVVEEYGEHLQGFHRDGGSLGILSKHDRFLKLTHHIHSFVYGSLKKALLKEQCSLHRKGRTTECFDDYFPCRKKKVN